MRPAAALLLVTGTTLAGCGAYQPPWAGAPGDTYCMQARAEAASAARDAGAANASAAGWAPYGGTNARQSAALANRADAAADRAAGYVRRDCGA
ncbi:hypothetical protein M0638_09370 [Roseomonas sp. NAR14]|uniref:Lipoprotein n=1 Tax=Roseomonas acroporae TaxID=2937791 RepID=A0A9X2BX42_9PROT|nr:hypothetical protein [Roseomonas acroporae]MCK8784590.1 hypothetical protein [Roseomonas acroporae]